MLVLRKLLKLPGPIKLGRSIHSSLPLRALSPDTTGYTWEDWHAEVRSLHPVKYWIAETASNFVRFKIWLPIIRPLKETHYWLVSHLIPKRRYHMLDLRQPGGYQYGWKDVPEKMLYAQFNLLKEYFDEKPYDVTKDYTLEEINDDEGLKNQHESFQEAKEILNWWTVQKEEEQKAKDALLTHWSNIRKNKTSRQNGEVSKAWELMKQADKDYEDKIDKMLARLIKIRRSLWT